MHKPSERFQVAVRQAAEAKEPIRPGMSIQAQVNAACENLGYPRGHWRVKEAWYGTAKNWRCEPAFEFISRYYRLRKECGSRFAAADDPFNLTHNPEKP